MPRLSIGNVKAPGHFAYGCAVRPLGTMSASATASAGLPQLSNKTLLIHTKEEPPAPVPNGYMPSVNGVTVGSLSQRELAEHILVCANAYKQMSENSVTTSACNSILHLAGFAFTTSTAPSLALSPAPFVPFEWGQCYVAF